MEKHKNGLGVSESGVAYTLDQTGAQSVAMADLSVRRLTPVECERLQGFPDGWTSERLDPAKGVVAQADAPRYKQIGNAVAVPVVEWIVRRLVETEELER